MRKRKVPSSLVLQNHFFKNCSALSAIWTPSLDYNKQLNCHCSGVCSGVANLELSQYVLTMNQDFTKIYNNIAEKYCERYFDYKRYTR